MLSRMKWTDAAKGRIAILKQYEPIQPYLLQELSKALGAEVFLDIGANIGAYSVLMASLPTIQEAHAFEPTPETYSELRLNVAQNSYASKITPHQIALSDQAGTAAFGVISALSGANGIIDTSIHQDKQLQQRVEVKTSPLDGFLSFTQRVIAIKVDVEGHELQVLRGATQTLINNSCIVQIEDYQTGPQGLANLFLDCGYRRLFNVGPDQYFTNSSQLDEGSIVRAFSAASSTMVSENFTPTEDTKVRPIRLRFPLGFVLEVSGSLAMHLRAARNSVR